MKAIYKSAFVILSGLLLAVSCGEKDNTEPVDDNTNQKEEVQPVTKTLTFVLPENSISGKTAWVAGDQIVVHGEYAADQVIVTLAAGDISSDGKTASLSVDNLKPYTREDVTSTLYAGYPADAVNNLRHCFFYTQFNDTNRPLMAAYNTADDKFNFVDLNAAITFTAEGDYDSFTFFGNKKETIGYGVYQVKLTSNEENYTQYLNDPILTIDMPFTSGENKIYVPAGLKFAAGYTIKFQKDGANVNILKTHEEATVSHGSILTMGDVTADIEKYVDPFTADVLDLDKDGNANCYIITEPGSYKFKAVYGNQASNYLMDVEKATVLWETWNDDAEVERFSVVASADYTEDYMIIKTPATLHPGNAVVAALDMDGNILWSWHLWVPQTAIQTADYGGIMGGVLMDRNLGALVATEAGEAPVDPLSYGLVYQWGRKDPFTNTATFNGSGHATYAYDVPEGLEDGEAPEGAEVVADGQISLAEAIAHPTLLGHIDNGNWMDDVDETLWGNDGGKTIYDPCPAGYRVPVRSTSHPFWSADLTAAAGWNIDGTNGWLTIGDPAAVFPIAGYRDDYSVGGMARVGERTLYWTARGSEAKGYGADLRYDKGTYLGDGSAPKARLASVRCVAE